MEKSQLVIKTKKLADARILWTQTTLVEQSFKTGVLSYEDVENLPAEDEDGNMDDIFQWLLVDNWLAEQLSKEMEPLLKSHCCIWWGRTCYGLPLEDDPVLQKIANELQ